MRPLRWEWIACVLLSGFAAVLYARYGGLPFAVQDDQTQHVIWFRQFLPGAHLVRDPIGDFFIGSNSFLYCAFYRTLAEWGCDPVIVAWAVGATSIFFAAWGAARTVEALGVRGSAPAAAAILTVIMLAFHDDPATGSARAMGWPMLSWCLWAIADRKPVAFAVICSLAANIYPPVAVIALVVGGLMSLLEFSRLHEWNVPLAWMLAFALPMLVLLFLAGAGSAGGATVSAGLARTLPEFQGGGQVGFFKTDWYSYWISGKRSGFFSTDVWRQWPILVIGGAGIVLWRKHGRLGELCVCILAAGAALYVLAHLLLFALYLPSRYSSDTISIAAAISGAPAVAWLADRGRAGRAIVAGAAFVIPALLAAWTHYPDAMVQRPRSPSLITAILQNHTNGIVAGTSPDLKFVPATTGRNVYWADEFALPYKNDYRHFINGRLRETVLAVSSSSPEDALRWAARNRIALLLLDRTAFEKGRGRPSWMATVQDTVDWNRSWVLRSGPCRGASGEDWLVDMACVLAAYRQCANGSALNSSTARIGTSSAGLAPR